MIGADAQISKATGTSFHLMCCNIVQRKQADWILLIKMLVSFMCLSWLCVRSHVSNPSSFVMSLQPLVSILPISGLPQHTSRIPGFDYQPLENALTRSSNNAASHVTTSTSSSSSRKPQRNRDRDRDRERDKRKKKHKRRSRTRSRSRSRSKSKSKTKHALPSAYRTFRRSRYLGGCNMFPGRFQLLKNAC